MKLLLVDDEVITIKSIKKGIDWSTLPFTEVLEATSAEQAKSLFSRWQIDIMLCDIEMPGDNGLALLEWVRTSGYKTECIFLTCHEEFDFARKAVKLNGMDYLLKPIPFPELQAILLKACKEIQTRKISSQYEEYGKNHLMQLKTEAEKEGQKQCGKQTVELVKQYISAHLAEDLSAEVLAAQVYISSDYLFHLFKREEGTTIVEYITAARLFYASQLLENPEVSISRVAITVGYDNYSYFSKVFKKAYHVTPSQYQQGKRKLM